MSTPEASTVHIGHETETDRGWSYDVTLCLTPCLQSQHTVTLSWADHDRLTGGLHPPSRTMRAAMRVLLGMDTEVVDPTHLPGRFDLSTLRRMIEGFDDAVRERLD